MKKITMCLFIISAAAVLSGFSPYGGGKLPVEYWYKLQSLERSSSPRAITLIDEERKMANGLLFTYKNRKAESVLVAGTFSQWKPMSMKRGTNGIWYHFQSADDDAETGDIKYKFSVDGIWTPDPGNPIRENDGTGSFLSVSREPSMYKSTRITYRVTGKNTIEFRLYKPSARLISLVGDFNNWNPENDLMRRGDDGIWRLSKRLPAGRYRYIYLIDGSGTPDLYNPQSSSTVNGEVCSLIAIE
jgi:1,4-alpha-glucan branching enzyme